MPKTVHSKLADALERATKVARRNFLRTSDLSRGDRNYLLPRGYLQEIIKGWYRLTRPVEHTGESTVWYASFWDFLAVYLESRFSTDYCLSAPSSLDLHIGGNGVPEQVVAMSTKGSAGRLDLPHNTSLVVYQDVKNIPAVVEDVRGLRTMPLSIALCRMPPSFFEKEPVNAEIALRAVRSVDDLSRIILETNSPTLAARLAGAYMFIKDSAKAKQILDAARAADMIVEPKNPFIKSAPVLSGTSRLVSPYAGRIEALFKTSRGHVLDVFKDMPPKPVSTPESYLRHVEAVYEHDAYNSLSIEGYQVTPELIEKIRNGDWNPDGNPKDQQQIAAMAAKGYLAAFGEVKKCVGLVLKGEPAAAIVRREYQTWYRALFGESVRAGILEPYRLAGHRNGPIFIRTSRHVPPPHDAVSDALDALFNSLDAETEPIVRAVLGHWLFGFIHPYNDGNGRTARFLMNVMMASGGYPWTIVRTNRRTDYLAVLDIASVKQDVSPFAKFIREEMSIDWSKEPIGKRGT
jgi:hypothetical protein